MILNFAIIGCGNIAERHANQIKNCGGNLLACCDVDEYKAMDFSIRHKINYYFSAEEMLKNENLIDIVAVCSPNGLHFLHSKLSLKNGKHVICEKPMALEVDHCKEMIDLAGKNHKKLFIVMQNRFNPPVVEFKKIVENRLLGEIFNVHLSCHWNRNNNYYTQSNWKGTKALDGGILFTQFSHFIDILIWLFGEVETVHAIVKNFNHKEIIEIEDSGVVNLRFKSGLLCTINYSVNAYLKNYEGALTVIGENGTVKLGGGYLNKMAYCNIKDYQPKTMSEGNNENNYGEYTGSMSNHNLVYENVIDVLHNKATIATTGIEGLKTVELIKNIYSSAKWN